MARVSCAAGTAHRTPVLRAILFDLDNTLYDATAGLQEVGDERITRWIMDQLGLSREEADELRVRTWREYGTTARGLQAEYGLDPGPLYEYAISAIEPAEHLQPWPELDRMLSRLSVPCHVFTNATAVYAAKVLQALGVRHHFQRIFDIEHNNWVCKPNREVYENILRDLALPACAVALVEDNPRNLVPARELGMYTVLLNGDDVGEADLRIGSILELPDGLAKAGMVEAVEDARRACCGRENQGLKGSCHGQDRARYERTGTREALPCDD